MESQDSLKLKKLIVQTYSIERTVRMMRLEATSILNDHGHDNSLALGPSVRTGLSSLLSTKKRLATQACVPYQAFYPGVWVGLDQENGNLANIAVQTIGASDTGSEVASVPNSMLVLTPTFLDREAPRWFSLESEVDKAELLTASKARIEIACCFDVIKPSAVGFPRSLPVTLRGRNNDGGIEEFATWYHPLSSAWMDTAYEIDIPDLIARGLDKFSSIEVTMALPTSGNYKFSIGHFSVFLP